MSKRRGNGEGTLQHRADGRWSMSFFAGYQDNGKPLRKTVYGKTQQEAIEKGKKLREQIDKGVVINRRMTFEEWADEWYKGFEEVNMNSGSTYELPSSKAAREYAKRADAARQQIYDIIRNKEDSSMGGDSAMMQLLGGGVPSWRQK